ncbi:MAG: hypothetical protein K2X03_18330 [Bryobacteraceae bacterium]|nr:hypothetical protein [Bryobacteraceae bacterium]
MRFAKHIPWRLLSLVGWLCLVGATFALTGASVGHDVNHDHDSRVRPAAGLALTVAAVSTEIWADGEDDSDDDAAVAPGIFVLALAPPSLDCAFRRCRFAGPRITDFPRASRPPPPSL